MSVRIPALSSNARTMPRVYYGWVVLAVAAAAMVGTLPARTQGLGLITESLLADLGIGRVAYAELNLWATLVGAIFAIGIGRVLDRFGSRLVLTGVALGLGAVVCLMSHARSFTALAVCVTLTRGLGQSALSVVSIAMVGQWFVRRIDRAMALYSVALSIGFMLAFPLVGALVQRWGWRETWFAVGCALLAGLAPLGLLLVRRSPEVCGLAPDGEDPPGTAGLQPGALASVSLRGQEGGKRTEGRARLEPGVPGARPVVRATELPGHSWSAALATPAFWVFALGAALYGLVASGIGLFNESILAERGFGHEVYYRTLVVTALTALAGNFLGGWLAGRVPLARLLAIALFVLAGGLAALPCVSTSAHVMAWAVAMGLGGGLVMVLFFSVWPRLYGRRELGRIQGSAQALTVLASAIGPLLLAWCVEWTGSYAAMFLILACVIAALGAAALVVPSPARSQAAPGVGIE